MEKNRVLIPIGVIAAALATILGLWYRESVIAFVSLIALFLSCVSLKYCSNDMTAKCVLLMGFVTLVCSVFISLVSYETLVSGDVVTERIGMYIAGLAYTAPILPLVMVFYFLSASVFGATYHWFLVSVLSPFVGLGMFIPGYAAILFMQRSDIDSGLLENPNVVIGLMTSLIVLIVFAFVLMHIFKKNNYAITSNGIEIRPSPKGDYREEMREKLKASADPTLIRSDLLERRAAWFLLIFCPLAMMVIYAYVTAGLAPGINSGHPTEYLQATCIMWAVISAIIPLLRLLRIVSLPIWFVVLLNATMFLYVISLCQGFFLDVEWWGNLSHEIAAFIVAAIVFLALCLMQSNSPEGVTFGSRNGIIAMLIPISASFGCIWEIAEGYTDILSGKDYMVYGIADTLGDLFADILGLLIMALIAWVMLRRQSPEKIASKVRIGRNSMDVPYENTE